MPKQTTIKNGAKRREAIFLFINEKIKKPHTLNAALNKIRKRKLFSEMNFSTFAYNVKILIADNKIKSETSREIHPKRKPIILIQSLN